MKPYPRALLWVAMLGAIALMAAAYVFVPSQAGMIVGPGIPALIGGVSVDRWVAARALSGEGK